MKICFVCNTEKLLKDFYKHKMMADGHLNKCKLCTKEQSKARFEKLRKNPDWVESEKERSRERYHRLGYRDLYKPTLEQRRKIISKYKSKYPEKYAARMKSQGIPCAKGKHLHHWSYNKEHWKDCIELSVADHALLHRYMIYDQERMMYRNLKGELLDSKQSHIDLLNTILKDI